MTMEQAAPYLLTPKDRVCRAQSVKYTEGTVRIEPERAYTLQYKEGGDKPYLILDLGRSSPGGYPVISVKAQKGEPVLRLAYSDWYPYLLDRDHRETGDFLRGCCKYLGVELPVLPANPNRYELYTLHRTGKYRFPLIQGQQRFVLFTLDTPGDVEIDDFYIYYTADMSDHDGHFLCSRADLNQLWYSSTYTVQISSIESAQSWDVLENTLLVRALTKGNPAGIYRKGGDWENYRFTFEGQISVNPDCHSGIGWMVRAADPDNGYVFQAGLDGWLRWYYRKNGVNYPAGEKKLEKPLYDNYTYAFCTVLQGACMEVFIDGESILQWQDDTYRRGTIGFYQTTEKWAMVSRLEVTSGERLLLREDFSADPSARYQYTYSRPFLADGAKLDRLPWSGDLDWAGRNVYYAFSDTRYMLESLRMFARHQTPEGYIWGVCYPENTEPVKSGEYGYYESDIFSAWFVPTLWDYLLFTGDTEQVSGLYLTAVRDLDYLWSFVEGDGLFFQRYATSKGLWDHELNDVGKFSYNNIMMYDAFYKGALLAEALNDFERFRQFKKRAETMKEGIMRALWREDAGCFMKGYASEEYCHMANCLALAVGILTQEQAASAVKSLRKWFASHLVMGKIVSLFIRGCFRYGFDQEAYQALTGKTGLSYAGGEPVHVNWLDSIADENGPATTTECMLYPPSPLTDGKGWGDRSHPDTAVAHLLTGFLLGVEPLTPGFGQFKVEPHACTLTRAEGIIPTPYGKITAAWRIEDDAFTLEVTHPKEITPVISTRFVSCPTTCLVVNGCRLTERNESLSCLCG